MLEAQRQTNSQCPVDEIWAWEAVDHGDAAVINRLNLTSICKPPYEPLEFQKCTHAARS